MSDASFENFLLDTLTRSFENCDWISEQIQQLGVNTARDFAQINTPQRQAFHAIYLAMQKSLTQNVRIAINGDILPPQKIHYHPRFGWVLENESDSYEPKEACIYLGKISLLENTRIEMGKRSYFSGPATIRGGGELHIGQYCSLAESLYITTFNDNHPLNHPAMINFAKNRRLREDAMDLAINYPELVDKSCVRMGHDVWVGRNVRITGGVTIGNGCVIAEGSLVRQDCEAYGIYAGTPARLIRYRFQPDIIEQLQTLQWWRWAPSKIKRNRNFFQTDLSSIDTDLQSLLRQ